MNHRAAGVLAAGLLLVGLLSAAGCGARTSSEPAAPTEPQPASFALALGIDADDATARAPLAGYDLVVVDGQSTTAEAVEALQTKGATVLAYLSAGTVEPGRPWFSTAEDEGWLLDHWDDWDEWYADVDEPGLRKVIVTEARSELAKGFDGLFLDNTDMVQGHPDQRDGMRRLVAALDGAVGADRLLFAQNGDPAAAGIVDHLDGWNREDVSSTYDFDTETYVPVTGTDHRDALEQLRRLRQEGLLVTATDYAADDEGQDLAKAAEAACDAGAIPFASDIGLTRIADPPETCDRG